MIELKADRIDQMLHAETGKKEELNTILRGLYTRYMTLYEKYFADIEALNDEEIALTIREFNILYKLLSYPKKTISRQQLMDEFWDVGSTSGPRTVDVYMTKLRAKLADCEDFEIQTVHGLGYKAVVK